MSSTADHPSTIVALTTDMFFIPRLEDAARQLGFRLETISSDAWEERENDPRHDLRLTEPLEGPGAAIVRSLATDPPALILVDLASDSLPWAQWIQTLKTSSATRRVPMVAFGPHVGTEALDRATALGADRVVTRGQLQARLGEILRSEARPPDDAAIRQGCSLPLSAAAVAGLDALTSGAYFQAHEHLEHAVLEEPGPEGTVYRCLLHLSVAHLHAERGNWRGAQKMLLRMRPWLAPLPASCRGVEIGKIRLALEEMQSHLDRWRDGGRPPSSLPPPWVPFTRPATNT